MNRNSNPHLTNSAYINIYKDENPEIEMKNLEKIPILGFGPDSPVATVWP